MNRTAHTPVALAVFAITTWIVTLAQADTAGVAAAAAFVKRAEMRDWLADGERGFWIQAGNLDWFYARLRGICHGLSSTNTLVFDTQASGNIDRTSSVAVPGHGRCMLRSLTASSGPPENRHANLEPQPQEQ